MKENKKLQLPAFQIAVLSCLEKDNLICFKKNLSSAKLIINNSRQETQGIFFKAINQKPDPDILTYFIHFNFKTHKFYIMENKFSYNGEYYPINEKFDPFLLTILLNKIDVQSLYRNFETEPIFINVAI